MGDQGSMALGDVVIPAQPVSQGIFPSAGRLSPSVVPIGMCEEAQRMSLCCQNDPGYKLHQPLLRGVPRRTRRMMGLSTKRVEISGSWRGRGSTSAGTPGEVEQGEEGFCLTSPLSVSLWLNRIDHRCYSLHHRYTQPRPQTGGWRWPSSGRPQSWSLRTGRGPLPPSCGFHHS